MYFRLNGHVTNYNFHLIADRKNTKIISQEKYDIKNTNNVAHHDHLKKSSK